MRFVAIKTSEQQGTLMLHRTRHLLIRQQTAVINAIRAHLAEFGIVAPVGRNGVEELLDVVANPNDKRVPEVARACLAALGAQLRRLKEQILEIDRMIMAWHRSTEVSWRLDEDPRRRSGAGHRSGRQRSRSEGLPIRPELLGLDWAGAAAELQRRQGEARRYHQAR